MRKIVFYILLLCLINCTNTQKKDNIENHSTLKKKDKVFSRQKDSIHINEYDNGDKINDTISHNAEYYFMEGIELLKKSGFFLLTHQDTLTYLEVAGFLEKAIACDSSYLNAYINLSRIYYKLDSNNKALEVLNCMLDIAPKHVEAITTKGFILERMGKKEEASYQYECAIKIYSFKLNTTFSDNINKAFLYLLLCGKEEGINELHRIKEIYPDENVDEYIFQFKNFNRTEFIKDALE